MNNSILAVEKTVLSNGKTLEIIEHNVGHATLYLDGSGQMSGRTSRIYSKFYEVIAKNEHLKQAL